MATKNSAHVCEWKRLGPFAPVSLALILCIVHPGSVRAAKAPQKTDAELTEALIGTWRLVPSLGLSLAQHSLSSTQMVPAKQLA